MVKATPFFFLFRQKKLEIYLQSFCQGYQFFWRVDQSVACSTEPPQRSCSFQAVKYKASLRLSCEKVWKCPPSRQVGSWICTMTYQGKGKRPKNQRNKLSLLNSLSSWLVFYLFFSLLKSTRKFVIRVSLGSRLCWKDLQKVMKKWRIVWEE